MRHIYRGAALALFVATLPVAALAEEAFTLRDVDVFAGPSSEFPPVAQLPPGTQVQLAGCLSDWSWCDVIFANDRGWVYAGDLGYPYQGDRVVIIENGPRLRLPTVTFSIDNYWSAHYRARPWFGERQQWAGRVHVEANRGGPPPQGRQAQGRPQGGGGQAAQPAQPQATQPAQPSDQTRRAQPAQPEAGQAPQGEQREQRARPGEENRAPPQGMQQQQQQMKAPEREAQKQAPDRDAQKAGRQPEAMQQQAPQAREPAKGRPPEGALQAPQAGEQAKGRSPEGAQERSEGKRAPDRERPKEEGQ